MDEKEANVKAILEKFVPGPGEEDATGDPEKDFGQLQYKELSAELASEYKAICEKLEALEKIRKTVRLEILRLMGKGRLFNRDGWGFFVNPQSRTTIDWEKFARDLIGSKEVEELLSTREAFKATLKNSLERDKDPYDLSRPKYVNFTVAQELEVRKVAEDTKPEF